MAFIHLITAKDAAYVSQPPSGGVVSGLSNTVIVGNPSNVKKLAAVPAVFAAAGSPDHTVSSTERLLIINTDSALDVAVVRKGHAPSEVVPVPIPVIGSGISSYVMLLPPYASDIFVRAMT